MMKRAKHSGRRHQILALLDGQHPDPNGSMGGWTSASISGTCGIAWSSAHHALARLEKYGLIARRKTDDTVEYRRALGDGRTLVGRLPSKTLMWTITPKGRDRLKYFGGHKRHCLICAEAEHADGAV